VWDSNETELADLTAFETLIENDADAFAGHGDNAARTCAMQAIDAWAQSGALLGTMSYHGKLDRMWAAGAIALAIIKLHQPLDPQARQWFETVSTAARQEAEEHTTGFGVNNLSYWGALAVGASGIVLGSGDDWHYAQQTLRAGLDNISNDGTLERELHRKSRSTHYQEFAAQPLVVLARLSAWRGSPLSADDRARLGKLVALVIAAVNNPQLLANAAGSRQRPIRMPGWLVLWNGPAPTADGHDSVYIKLGGDTRVLNAVLSRPR
jgi:poly(beta-D-mannuronate) lyase